MPLAAVVTGDEVEVAIDVRRSGDVPLKKLTGDLLRACYGDAEPSRIHLEPWLATSASVIWEFNALYWKALDLWEQATGRRYEQALPGGESDARNRDAVREIITGLFALWDSLAERNALPEELYVIELGGGVTEVRPRPGSTSSSWTVITAGTTTGGCTT